MNILEVHADVLYKNRLLKLGVQGQHKFWTLKDFIEKKRKKTKKNRKINKFQLLEAKQKDIKFKTVLKRHNIKIDFTNILRKVVKFEGFVFESL